MPAPPLSLAVPRVGRRPGRWTVRDDGLASRRQQQRGSGVYEAAVPARLAELDFSVPAEIAADAADAESALISFDRESAARLAALGGGPGPMSAILLRTESSSSSRIENLTVGARQLASAELDASTSANARLVLANVRAMEAALTLSADLDLRAVLTMHDELLGADPAHGGTAGALRKQLVWIGRSALSPIGADHVAPEAEDVPEAMTDLMRFAAREDLPVLVQTAIAHAQFETIHPFTDGNGRTGRALVHALLHGKGLLRTLTAPVSAGLLHDMDGYVTALDAFRAGDAAPIVEAFAAAARFAAVTGGRLIEDLEAAVQESSSRLEGLRPQALGWRLLPRLVAQPVVDSAHVRRDLGVSDTSALRALAQLEDAGVLTETTGARRRRIWRHDGILAVLDDYAESIRRRG